MSSTDSGVNLQALEAASLLLGLCSGAGPAAPLLQEVITLLRSGPSERDLEHAIASIKAITNFTHRTNIKTVLHNTLDRILDFSTIRDAVRLGQTSVAFRYLVRNYIVRRLHSMLKTWVKDPQLLRVIMRDTKAVISGSWVLAFLLGLADDIRWEVKDIDFYVPWGYACKALLGHLTNKEGYVVTDKYPTTPVADADGFIPFNTLSYDFAKRSMRAVYKLHKEVLVGGVIVGVRSIDVIESKSMSNAVEPIMHFDKTYVMNWIAYDSIVCLYPTLTFDKIGVDQSYRTGHKIEIRKAKYAERGFSTVRDTAELRMACGAACVSLTRDTHDVGTMVVPLVEGGGSLDEMPQVRWKLARERILACANPRCPRALMGGFALRSQVRFSWDDQGQLQSWISPS
ncbi:hypothetical protein FRB94_009620 [Tulasnella sp. JGI-2019a]|nr:hypothetical protein FRB94_009620 [Tulasnella sp. JGI-2019a]KAG9017760.1 hypothetical protein FRB93_004571 [Tulasnella sp. JGI-2019a]KAG9035829.1 hypothetical protein FRB95_010423 [Tulasnella sp. JGI-2019a]